jgi:hypothetical protein
MPFNTFKMANSAAPFAATFMQHFRAVQFPPPSFLRRVTNPINSDSTRLAMGIQCRTEGNAGAKGSRSIGVVVVAFVPTGRFP